ncbi:MAG: DUF6798 domain-containing protein [Thermoguttaceae bacterium]
MPSAVFHPAVSPLSPTSRRRALAEVALIFAVFFLQGAWPVPEVNEPHYLGKAIHDWNPDWLRGDFFIETPDVHRVFNFGFGWLSLWLGPVPLAWAGRALTWLLLAWAWRRLSWAIVPRPWCSVLTAALFGWLMENCHMAGEWVVGGVEAKGVAYALVLLGLEAIVRNRWNRGLLWLGAASSLHVLVGGWAAIAAGVAWLWLAKPRPPVAGDSATTGRGGPHPSPLPKGERTVPSLRSLWPGLLGGLLLALPGILPALALDGGAGREMIHEAHAIYVYERLPHHLLLSAIQPWFIARLALLWAFWIVVGWMERRRGREEKVVRLRAFVTGAVVICLTGAAINALVLVDRSLAADLMRLYWFRLTDVALPLAVALEGVGLLAAEGPLSLWERVRVRANVSPLPLGEGAGVRAETSHRPQVSERRNWLFRRAGWLLALGLAAYQLGGHAVQRMWPSEPRAEKMANPADWRAACEWVARSGKVPRDAIFLVPRGSQTFTWYSHHGEVVAWKDVPQDAEGLVQWWRRMKDIYDTGLAPPEQWRDSLGELSATRLRQLGAKYGAGYVITGRPEHPPACECVYENPSYLIYRLR